MQVSSQQKVRIWSVEIILMVSRKIVQSKKTVVCPDSGFIGRPLRVPSALGSFNCQLDAA